MEAPRPEAGASRKGSVFVKVPLPASKKGHRPATRRASAADPLRVEQLSAMPDPKNNSWDVPRLIRRLISNKIAVLRRERCTSKVELSLIISMTVIARAKRSSKYSYISMVHREEGIGRPLALSQPNVTEKL